MDELSTAFVRLGIGEYGEAMVIALTPMVREGRLPLPDQLRTRLLRVQQVYYLDRELTELLARATG